MLASGWTNPWNTSSDVWTKSIACWYSAPSKKGMYPTNFGTHHSKMVRHQIDEFHLFRTRKQKLEPDRYMGPDSGLAGYLIWFSLNERSWVAWPLVALIGKFGKLCQKNLPGIPSEIEIYPMFEFFLLNPFFWWIPSQSGDSLTSHDQVAVSQPGPPNTGRPPTLAVCQRRKCGKRCVVFSGKVTGGLFADPEWLPLTILDTIPLWTLDIVLWCPLSFCHRHTLWPWSDTIPLWLGLEVASLNFQHDHDNAPNNVGWCKPGASHESPLNGGKCITIIGPFPWWPESLGKFRSFLTCWPIQLVV